MSGELYGHSLARLDFNVSVGHPSENRWITNRTWTDPSTEQKQAGEVLEAFLRAWARKERIQQIPVKKTNLETVLTRVHFHRTEWPSGRGDLSSPGPEDNAEFAVPCLHLSFPKD